ADDELPGFCAMLKNKSLLESRFENMTQRFELTSPALPIGSCVNSQPLGITAKQSSQAEQTDELKEAVMNALQHVRTYLLRCILVLVLQPPQGLAQQNSDTAKTKIQEPAAQRDGQHDFDFEIGT